MIRANTTRWCSLVGVMAQPGSTSEPIGAFCFSLRIGGRGTTSMRASQTRQSALALRRHELMRSICLLLALSRNGLVLRTGPLSPVKRTARSRWKSCGVTIEIL